MESAGTSAPSPGEVAREFIEDVLAAGELAADVELAQTEEGTWHLSVVGDDAEQLVGLYGNALNALQYLTTLVILRHTGEHVRLVLDAGGYRERREAALVEQAQLVAAEVKRTGQEAELDPLSAFERRIIHNALLDDADIVTYSEGNEPDRRVVIAPREAPPA